MDNMKASSMRPLVSVLVPAYNHERYIEECILSVAAQDYDNIELIVIDDGSPDGTWDKIAQLKERLQRRFRRMLCLRQENMGTAASLRRLQGLFEGDYVTSVASDDVLKPHMISTLLNEIVKTDDYGVVVGDAEFIDNNSERVYWNQYREAVPVAGKETYSTFAAFYQELRRDVDFNSNNFGSYASLLRGNYIPQAFMVKANLYRDKSMFSAEAPLEDWFFVLQVSKVSRLRFINKVVYSYRWHGDNTVKNARKMKLHTYNTLSFEYNAVMNGGDVALKEIINSNIYNSKTVFKMAGLHLYKKKSFKDKILVLEFCGAKIFSIVYK